MLIGTTMLNGIAAAITALWTSPTPAPTRWQWPLHPTPHVLRTFSPPAHPWESGHRGVDLTAHPNQPIYAAGPGRVTYAQDLAGRGVITITHGPLRTTYLPVTPSVHPGQTVKAGTPIGRLQSAIGHCGQTPCLHWGLLQAGTYLDPLSLLGLAPVRLLPWWPDDTQTPPPEYNSAPPPMSDSAPPPVNDYAPIPEKDNPT